MHNKTRSSPKKKRADSRQRSLFTDASLHTSYWHARLLRFQCVDDEEAGLRS